MSHDDRPTLPEQYTRAMSSSHLELAERTRGDVDLLIAAGWVKRDALATKLYRLACEFDAARGEQTQARRRIAVATAAADELEKRAASLLKSNRVGDAMVCAMLAQQAGSMRDEIAHELVSERAFLLVRLKSLADTKEALGYWAMERAIRTRFKTPGPLPTESGPVQPQRMALWRAAARARHESVMKISGRVLDVFLDNLCAPCQGRGTSGGYGGPQKICRACSGSGKRSSNLGGEPAEENFGRHLLAELESLLDGVEREMKRYLAQAGASAVA